MRSAGSYVNGDSEIPDLNPLSSSPEEIGDGKVLETSNVPSKSNPSNIPLAEEG